MKHVFLLMESKEVEASVPRLYSILQISLNLEEVKSKADSQQQLLVGVLLLECGKIKKPEEAGIMKEIIDEVREPPSYEKWSTENKVELVEMKKKEINMGDTALGRHQEVQKREME